MTMFKNDITHQPLVVSNASTDVVVRALVQAYSDGAISDVEYVMTYAEICEIGYRPQAFGGRRVEDDIMQMWKDRRSWARSTFEETVAHSLQAFGPDEYPSGYYHHVARAKILGEHWATLPRRRHKGILP